MAQPAQEAVVEPQPIPEGSRPATWPVPPELPKYHLMPKKPKVDYPQIEQDFAPLGESWDDDDYTHFTPETQKSKLAASVEEAKQVKIRYLQKKPVKREERQELEEQYQKDKSRQKEMTSKWGTGCSRGKKSTPTATISKAPSSGDEAVASPISEAPQETGLSPAATIAGDDTVQHEETSQTRRGNIEVSV